MHFAKRVVDLTDFLMELADDGLRDGGHLLIDVAQQLLHRLRNDRGEDEDRSANRDAILHGESPWRVKRMNTQACTNAAA